MCSYSPGLNLTYDIWHRKTPSLVRFTPVITISCLLGICLIHQGRELAVQKERVNDNHSPFKKEGALTAGLFLSILKEILMESMVHIIEIARLVQEGYCVDLICNIGTWAGSDLGTTDP